MPPTHKRLVFIALGLVCAAIVGIVALTLFVHHDGGGESGGSTSHGSSVAVWVAIGTAVWVPLMAGAARRRRERDKDKK